MPESDLNLTNNDVAGIQSDPPAEEKKKRAARTVKKSTVTAEIKPDPFDSALQKQALEVPIFTQDELDKVQVDPLAFHPAIQKLEDEERYKFCWMPKPSTQKDRELLSLYHTDYGAQGRYVYATRHNIGHELSEADADDLFSVSGAIEKGDLALGVCRYEVYEAVRQRAREAGVSQARSSRSGRDSQGKIPNVAVDDGSGVFDYTIPGQIMYNDEEEVDEAPIMYNDMA